jgi:putative ABC transport system substrate-binding protein
MRHIGVLSGGSPNYATELWDAFREQLRQQGWVEGSNLTIEWRYAESRAELVPQLAADLVSLPVEIILAGGTAAAVAARQHTNTIPIVVAVVFDPVAQGLVTSLGHPGGNVTGITDGGAAANIKSVELLKAVLPQLSRLTILEDQSFPARALELPPITQTAARLGVQTQDLDVRRVEDVEGALEAARTWGSEALHIYSNASFNVGIYASIAELAAQEHLPSCFTDLIPASKYGGLMGFNADQAAEFRLAAEYVDKILRGGQPADLPVVEPRQYDFVVNVKTAQDLGITFPPDAAAQVTQWIQ